MDLNYPVETEPFQRRDPPVADGQPAGGWAPRVLDDQGGAQGVPGRLDGQLFGRLDLRLVAQEYGRQGLSLMESVVLNEEFRPGRGPLRADFFGDTLVGPTILQWASEEQKQQFIPGILKGTIAWCQASASPTPARTWPASRRAPNGTATSGSSTPEGVDHPGPVRRYIFPAGPHRPGRPEARRHLLPAGAHGQPASRSGRSPRSRQRRLQRDLLHERPLPRGERGRRRQQRVEGGP